jgi:hypothetical protein
MPRVVKATDVRYPATEFEQLALKVVQALDGQGDQQAIRRKLRESLKAEDLDVLAAVPRALDWLESIGYVSSTLPEGGEPDSGQSRKVYRIESFGERALAAPPVYLPDPNRLRSRVIFAVLLLGIENWNAFFLHITWLYWPVRLALGVAVIWAGLGAYQAFRINRLYDNVRSVASRTGYGDPPN